MKAEEDARLLRELLAAAYREIDELREKSPGSPNQVSPPGDATITERSARANASAAAAHVRADWLLKSSDPVRARGDAAVESSRNLNTDIARRAQDKADAERDASRSDSSAPGWASFRCRAPCRHRAAASYAVAREGPHMTSAASRPFPGRADSAR